MKRILIITTLLTLVITACAAAEPTEAPSIIIKRPTATPTPEWTPAEDAVIERLAANLGLQESDVSVVSSEQVEFRNSCLGVVVEDIPCAQVITPGYKIVLEANGLQYEYHTSRDGDLIQPATRALTWKREGGIAGFCDTLTVFRSGEVFATKCKPQAEDKVGTFADLLTDEEQAQFNDWVRQFAKTDLDDSDPKGVADGMKVTLEFFGTGSKPPAESEQQLLFEFAQNLYQEVTR